MSLSVIVCTYNPRLDFFGKCLQMLTIACENYMPLEIIIVDNNSNPKLADLSVIQEFLASNNNARVVIETNQGLTPARLKGIAEAKGEILLFVDDDNWIDSKFFVKGEEVARVNPQIGAWSGQVRLHFEKEPENWTRKYWGLLVHREFTADFWSNLPHLADTMPCGAGLFVRKSVALHYRKLHLEGKRKIQLDRTGKSLFSGGDNDLAACACDMGLGVGLFSCLKLDHFIPANRLNKEYLLKLAKGISASAVVLYSFRGQQPVKPVLRTKVANIIRYLMKNKTDRAFFKAVLEGEKEGRKLLRHHVDY